jgi:hypothetical protein
MDTYRSGGELVLEMNVLRQGVFSLGNWEDSKGAKYVDVFADGEEGIDVAIPADLLSIG